MKGSAQVKARIKRWAESTNRWDEFVKVREGLKRDGVSPSDAWLAAAQVMDSATWGESKVVPVRTEPVREVLPADLPQVRSEVVDGARREVFGGKKVPTVKVVEWVASNLQVEDVGPSDAPSSEAWGMLVWARRSPVNESQFWGSIYAKLLPSRSQLDGLERQMDDGSRVEELADRLIAIRERVEVRDGP